MTSGKQEVVLLELEWIKSVLYFALSTSRQLFIFENSRNWKKTSISESRSRVWFHRLDYFYPTGQARGSMQYSNEEACIAFATLISFLHHIMVRCYISHFISIEPSHTSNAFSAYVVNFLELVVSPAVVGWSCKHPWIPVLRRSALTWNGNETWRNEKMDASLMQQVHLLFPFWFFQISFSNHIWQLFNGGTANRTIGLPMHPIPIVLPDWWTWWLFGLVLLNLFGVYYTGVLKQKRYNRILQI